MSDSTCGEPHPDRPGFLCEMPAGMHEWHTSVDRSTMPPSAVDWPNPDYVPAQKTRTKAQRMEQAKYLRERVRQHAGGPPPDAMEAWAEKKADWIEAAKRTLRVYCQQHSMPFTTPEDIWPLLESPGEMRAFTVVVQHAIRRRWIREVDSRRLRGVYTTRDGKQFEMNKIVPVYQSRIAIPVDL